MINFFACLFETIYHHIWQKVLWSVMKVLQVPLFTLFTLFFKLLLVDGSNDHKKDNSRSLQLKKPVPRQKAIQNGRDLLPTSTMMTDNTPSDSTLYEDSGRSGWPADDGEEERWAFLRRQFSDNDELAALYSGTFSQL
jgi:hypothetical protein